jgi:hypothetical protein
MALMQATLPATQLNQAIDGGATEEVLFTHIAHKTKIRVPLVSMKHM